MRVGSPHSRLRQSLAIVLVVAFFAALGPVVFGAVSGAADPLVCAPRSCPYHGPTQSLSFDGGAQSAITSSNATQLGGYWLAGSDGGVFTYGRAHFFGSAGSMDLRKPIVGMVPTPDRSGYWLTASDGGVFTYGDAAFFGSMGGTRLNAPIVGMAPAPFGNGYWLVASDGGVFAFGSAHFYGSMGGSRLNAPIVGIAVAPFGLGYWLVAADGGVFAFGSARFDGSMGGVHLDQPVVGMAANPFGTGYWLVASDGGIFSFGSARFYGSTGGQRLTRPVVGMAAGPLGLGYWLVASDGGVFAFGDGHFAGSAGSIVLAKPIVAMGSAIPDTVPATSSGGGTGTPTSLVINVTNLPPGAPAKVQITSPSGARETVQGSTTINPAAPGQWVVTASPVSSGAETYYPAVQTTNIQLASGNQGIVSVDYTQVVNNTVRIADPSAVTSVTPPDASGNQTASVGDPNHLITSGDVLSVGIGTATPEGLLLNVTKVTSSGSVDAVSGTEASLTDIGPQADIVADQSYSDPRSIDDLLTCSGSISASLTGSVDFSPHVHLELHWGGVLHPGTIRAQVSVSGTEAATLDAKLDAQGSCSYDANLLKTPITLTPIDVQVGPIPIVIVPKLNFEVEATANADGSLETSASQTLSVTAGVNWDGTDLTSFYSLSNSSNYTPLTPAFNGNIHAQVGPNLTFDIEDVTGPFLSANGHIDLHVDSATSPWWILTGGIEAGGGLKFDVWKTHFDQEDPGILSKTWTIAQADTPPPLTITTDTLGTAVQGTNFQTILKAAGGTPPYSWSIASGSLPAGMTLDPGTGEVSGVPTLVGTTTFSVRTTDADAATVTKSFTLSVVKSGPEGSPVVLTSKPTKESFCALLSTGVIRCWGDDTEGQLGDGSMANSAIPQTVIGITNATDISTTNEDSYCAVLNSGAIYCWGVNANGQLGDGGAVAIADTPVQVTGITNAASVVGDNDSYCAVLKTGAVDCWGDNYQGNLGDGATESSTVPVTVTNISNAVSITADGDYTYCAILSTGGVDCWGAAQVGQVGNGTTPQYSDVAVPVTGISNAKALSADPIETFCALLGSGEVDCWGDNQEGDLGDGTTQFGVSAIPMPVVGISDAERISNDYAQAFCVTLANGSVECWGQNADGALGVGMNSSFSATPVTPSGLSNVSGVFGGLDSFCAVLQTASIQCWGNGVDGQLGNGVSEVGSNVPVPVTGIANASSVTGSNQSFCASLLGGGVACWGLNNVGQLGNGTDDNSNVPISVLDIGS